MSNLSDPEAVIKTAEPGTMIYGRARFDGGAWETALYVREEKRYIDGFGRAPVVELRWMSVDDGSGVVLAALLMRIDNELYETWLNYHASGSAEAFADLASQDRIAILLYTRRRERQIAIANNLKLAVANSAEACRSRPAWTMQAFERARVRLYQRLPSVQALWDALA